MKKTEIDIEKLHNIECFLLDMDGTFYLGDELIDGALRFIDILKQQHKEFVFLTNNSSRSSRKYQDKLDRLGLKVSLDRIVNSGQVTADYLKKLNKKARIYVVGTPSLQEEIANAGLQIIKNKQEKIDYLVLGFDTTLTYKKLWDAHDLILEGVNYLATNPDAVCPLPGGKSMPDCGSMISLLNTSTGKKPLVVGKPNTLMIDYVGDRTGIKKDKMALIGDRLYTDIQTAINAEITSILVLTGETDRKVLEQEAQNPDFVMRSIAEVGQYLKYTGPELSR